MKSQSILSILFIFLWVGIDWIGIASAEDDSLPDELRQVHIQMRRVRDELYGNCYLEGSERTVKEDSESTNYFRFWSRNNEFFRYDIFSDPNFETLTDRLIVRPEGFFRATASENGSTVEEWGNSEKSQNYLAKQRYFRGSCRGWLGLPVETVFASFAGIEGFAKPSAEARVEVKKSSETDKRLELSVNISKGESTHQHEIVFSMNKTISLQHFESTSRLNDEISNWSEGDFRYGERSDAIPELQVSKSKLGSQGIVEVTTAILQMSLEPQPLEIFSF